MVTRQFDVFKNPNPKSARAVPFLLCVQHRVLEHLSTRVMVPLVRPTALSNRLASRLNPEVLVGRERLVLLTQQVGAVQASSLGPPIANLEGARAAILAAVDLVFTGL